MSMSDAAKLPKSYDDDINHEPDIVDADIVEDKQEIAIALFTREEARNPSYELPPTREEFRALAARVERLEIAAERLIHQHWQGGG